MASGSFAVSSSNSYVKGTLTWSSSVDEANNRSLVTATLRLSRTNSGYTTYGSGTFYVKINGVTLSDSGSYTITYNSNTVMVSASTYVPHNSNGSKEITISTWGSMSGVLSVSTHSGKAVLDDIPRASTLSSNANWTAGDQKTISVARASSSFTHWVWFYVKDTAGTYQFIGSRQFDASAIVTFSTAEITEMYSRLAQRTQCDTKITLQTYNAPVSQQSSSNKVGEEIYYGTMYAQKASIVSSETDRHVWVDETIGIGITRYNSDFTHKIELAVGSYNKVVSSSATTSANWTPTTTETNSMCAQMPNEQYKQGYAYITTYYNGVQVRGRTSTWITFYVRNAEPTFNDADFAYEDINATTKGITGNNQFIIQGESIPRVIFYATAKGQKSATIDHYVVSIGGQEKVTSGFTPTAYMTFDPLSYGSDQTLTVKVVDSRGFETVRTKTVKVLEYQPPQVTTSASRLNNFEESTTIKLSGSVSPLYVGTTPKNSVVSMTYEYKLSTSGTYLGPYAFDPGTATFPNFKGMDEVLNLNNLSAWHVRVTVKDKLRQTVITRTVPVGKPILFIDTAKNSVGVGKFPVNNDSFEVANDLYVGDSAIISGDASIHGALDVTGNMEVFGAINANGMTIDSNYLQIYPYSSSYGSGTRVQIYYDHNNKRLRFGSRHNANNATDTVDFDINGTILNDYYTEASLLNSWEHYSASTEQYQRAAFWKDKNGVVHITGLIKSAQSDSYLREKVIFYLPVGYRPVKREIFERPTAMSVSTSTLNNSARIDIDETGAVWGMYNLDATYTSLAGLSFKAVV